MQVDAKTVELYAKSAPELLDAITGEGDDCIMKRDATTDLCVKYENRLCGIQKKYGAGFLSDACNNYPRMTRTLGNSNIVTGALSCPEIARLALFGTDAFAWKDGAGDRIPLSSINCLPEGMNEAQAFAIHSAFIDKALQENQSASRSLMHIYCVAESLEKIPASSWPDAVPFYLEQAENRLPPLEKQESDAFLLLQALCGLIAAAKKGQHKRLMQNVRMMETALHVTIQWDNLAIAHLPDSLYAAAALEAEWKISWQSQYEPVLRRYLAAQMSLSLFPFGGLGDTFTERMSIIAVRFATIRLALMSACKISSTLPTEEDCVRIIQTLSRFLDHLGGATLSLTIYKQAGWLERKRLRALVGDKTTEKM